MQFVSVYDDKKARDEEEHQRGGERGNGQAEGQRLAGSAKPLAVDARERRVVGSEATGEVARRRIVDVCFRLRGEATHGPQPLLDLL